MSPGAYVESLGRNARRAAGVLAGTPARKRSEAIRRIAVLIRENRAQLIEANALDISAAIDAKMDGPLVERLKLNDKRVESMAKAVEQIAEQADPVGATLEEHTRPDGLKIEKRRVPIGVVLFFYESRPNVTSDAAALCLRSGNAIILRGGKEAIHSNRAIAALVARALEDTGLDPATVQLVESTDRALVPLILKLDRYIDLVIPRGGESLIRAVVAESTIPVLKHYTGNCHIYIDRDATDRTGDASSDGTASRSRSREGEAPAEPDAHLGTAPGSAGASPSQNPLTDAEQKIIDLCVNAKTSYPGGAVCNAAEKILIHRDVAARLLAPIARALASKGVEIRADESARKLYPEATPATDTDWPLEYLSLTIAFKVVASLDEAIAHINEFGSRHTDAILSQSQQAIDEFVSRVDSASIMINASTRFADGGEYGLGAEIGISTDKLHARGPMGAADMCTYKWVVTGNGHVR